MTAATPLLLAGCGDIGLRVARLALARGTPVSALLRSDEQAAILRDLGISTLLGDLDDGSRPIAGLPSAGVDVIYTVPPPGGGVIDPRLRVFCGSIEPGEEPRKIIYLSSTAVYGDCAGQLIDETTEPLPTTARGRRRLDAEQLLRQWGALRGVAVVILRVSGIYGPGRFPLQRIRAGEPVLREDLAPLSNRIHADDLARVCLAALERAEDGEIFNVSDGAPSSMTAYFNAVADAFGLPHPPQVDRAEAARCMSPLMLSYFSESRRIDSRRLRERLGIELLYPDLARGLAASVTADAALRGPCP